MIRDIWKKYGMFLVLTVCFLLAGISAQAVSQTGSISLQLPEEARGAEFTVFKVADYQSDGTFVYTQDFAGSTVSLIDVGDAQAAQNVAEQFWLQAQAAGLSCTVYRAGADGLVIPDLAPGYYLLVQTSGQSQADVQKLLAPVPYMASGTSDLVYDVELSPKYEIPAGAAILTKHDGEGVPVSGAHFDLERKVYIVEDGPAAISMETGLDAGGRFAWDVVQHDLTTNENGQIAMENLPLGMYRLIETVAPAGYFLDASPVYFEIKAEGVVQTRGASFIALEGSVEQVTAVNQPTRTQVNKVNEDGSYLPGAYFVIKNADGSGIFDENGQPKFWLTTTGEPYTLKGLPPGDYLLCELFSPQGYTVTPDVPFTVSPDPNAVNTVTMVDKEEQETQDTLHVTKYLKDVDGDNLAPIDDTFYVALFSDEERTQRVSDVKALHFVGESSATAVFENLQPDTTYYVGETDVFGTMTDMGERGGQIYTADFPNGYEVRLTQQKLDDEVVFENMFYDIPEEGYYIMGELTVTKLTLLNGEDYPRKGKFYAGIFRDAALTELEGAVIELPMGGKNSVSVTREVTIGKSVGSSMTYYVAETDKSGVPLDPGSVEEFVITVDNSKVTLSTDAPSAEVTITNDFVEEQTEIETETEIETYSYSEDTPGSPGTPGTPGAPGTPTSSTAPRTGDDTPIALYVGLLVAALAVIVIAVVVMRKRRK